MKHHVSFNSDSENDVLELFEVNADLLILFYFFLSGLAAIDQPYFLLAHDNGRNVEFLGKLENGGQWDGGPLSHFQLREGKFQQMIV